MNRTDVAYAAGFFDGEGSVTIGKAGSGRGLVLTVVISQKETEPLLWLQEHWGGCLVTYQTGISGLVLQGPGAAKFLRAVLPFLRVKRAAANVGLAFQARRRGRGGGKPLPDEEIKERQALRVALRAINGRNG